MKKNEISIDLDEYYKKKLIKFIKFCKTWQKVYLGLMVCSVFFLYRLGLIISALGFILVIIVGLIVKYELHNKYPEELKKELKKEIKKKVDEE